MSATINSSDCFKFVTHDWVKNGKARHEKRLVFSDPSNRVLTAQVERFRKDELLARIPSEDPAASGLIQGIKVHSKAMHIFCEILKILTFGIVTRSIKVKIDNQVVYISLKSYEKWRHLNGETISALGVVQTLRHKSVARERTVEIQKLVELLKTPLPKRTQIKPSITTARDPFQLVSIALKWAEIRMNLSIKRTHIHPEKYERVKHQLAAFYILLTSKIETDCEGELLRLSDQVTVTDKLITDAEAARLIESDSSKLSAKELKQLSKIQPVYASYEGQIYQSFINTDPDTFSSPQQGNNPLAAKRCMIAYGKRIEDRWSAVIDELLKPATANENPRFSTQEGKEFFGHIARLGVALRQQFNKTDALPSMMPAFKQTFLLMAKRNLINEDNLYSPSLAKGVGTLTALELLSHSSVQVNEDDTAVLTCTVDDETPIVVTYPNDHYFSDKALKKSYEVPYINAFGGLLSGEHAPLCTREALEFSMAYAALQPEEVFLLNEFISRRLKAQLSKNKMSLGTVAETFEKELTQMQFSPLHLKFQEFFTARTGSIYNGDFKPYLNIKNLAADLEKIGGLIAARYWSCVGNIFTEAVDIGNQGQAIVDEKELEAVKKLTRSPAQQAETIKKYFGNMEIALPQARTEPQIDKAFEDPSKLNNKDLLNMLFSKPKSCAATGHCCVGALAQAVFGKYEPGTGKPMGQDFSRDGAIIKKIRQAVSKYMLEHPDDFVDLVPCESDDPLRRKLFVGTRAHQILGNEWFGTAELMAFSCIVGRPLYVLQANSLSSASWHLTKEGSITWDSKFNTHFDADPIYLMLSGGHYDHMRPKRIGKKMI